MAGSLIITGLMGFFSVTTVAIIAYPIVRLTPSWLEGRLNRQIAFHRQAADALVHAMAQAPLDAAQQARLAAQLEFHRGALMDLVPGAPVPHAMDELSAAA
jgi:hypothetical protein